MPVTSVTLTRGVANGAFSFAQIAVANDTVSIGDVTYTFKATVGTTANEVLIGSNADSSVSNLAAAINAVTGSGVTWGSLTVANPYVTAAADTTADEIDLSAKYVGAWFNGIRLAATGTAPSATAAAIGLITTNTDGAGNLSSWASAVETEGFSPNAAIIAALHEVTVASD